MHTSIDHNSRIPAYMQLYSTIRSKIINGSYSYGSRLPSKRIMAENCGVSVSTVEHAYAILCDEGYCTTRQRSGIYVTYRPEESFPVPADLPESDDISVGEYFSAEQIAFSAVAAQIRRVLLDYGQRILMKSPNNGCIELRTAICRYLSRSRNINVLPEQIIIGSGAEYLYGICIQLLGRDRLIALESPSYEKIRSVYEANGAECEMLEMDNEGIRPDKLKETNASVLHVTPFNSYPSGITASAERRNEYISWAEERDAFIIEDDYDSEFILTGTAPETLFSTCTSGSVIYINTFSKTIAPSIRAGYMLLPQKLLHLYEKNVGFYSCTVPMLEQFFLAEWINSGNFERSISRLRHRKG